MNQSPKSQDRTAADVLDGGALQAPADPATRIELLDALRGFALFGVCLANLFIFSYWDVPITRTLSRALLPTDHTAHYLMEALVEGRFYSIFSLLFGLGFALQLQRAETRGGDAIPLFTRRIRILMLIGFAHLLLLWLGDILLFYALMGIVLMRMRRMSDERVIRWAAVFVLIPVVLYLPVMISPAASLAVPFFAGAFGITKLYHVDLMHMQDAMYSWFTSGKVVDWFKLTTSGIWMRYADLFFTGRPFKVLAMFTLGMWIGRRRMWSDLDAHAPLLRKCALFGFLVGLPASFALASMRDADLYFKGTLHGLAESALYAVAVAPLALAYAATFALLWRRSMWQRVLGVFAPAGKMALTNYLSQTVIAIIIYSGFGFGLAGRVGPTYLWLEAIATLALQIIVSKWWLARYRFGPMEWVWRSATYRTRQPMVLLKHD
ncbi:MAG TPA: DUF418 domain-containing protein [Longimicrobiales bacterium]|nr:DUF418 domain-containing protein [Longimicrobiales bacterium]